MNLFAVLASPRFMRRIEMAASSSLPYVERLLTTAIGCPLSVPRDSTGPCTVRSTTMSGYGAPGGASRSVRRSIGSHLPLNS